MAKAKSSSGQDGSRDKSQEKRIARLMTAEGDDLLVASRLDATEGLSRLFEYRIEGLSEDENLDLDVLIGRNMTMSVETPDKSLRYFDGIVVEADYAGRRHDDHVYSFLLRPWFWLLSRRTDCRIFHELNVPDIVTTVMKAHSFALYNEKLLTKTYPVLEYTVQYRESDLDFCCRLMEKHGIGYYFEHELQQHTLVLADGPTSYETISGGGGIAGGGGGGRRPYFPKSDRQHTDGEYVFDIVPQRRFTSGRSMLNAYDFKKPYANMKTNAEGAGAYEHSELEVYDYPGKYVETSVGSDYASVGINAETARDRRRTAEGELPSAFPGGLFTLTGHPRRSENIEYLILSATHTFAMQSYRSGGGDEDPYKGFYELLPSDASYAPPMVTPKARVYGPQTAVVVGSGEIDVDEYGRILVRFHWDRKTDKSRRVRVAQSSASQRWGGMVIPRIGMEVVVDFLEGDPDEPLVTGCVYHAKNMPPDTLPQFKTRSDFKTDTHQGSGYNQLRFEDENAQQEIYLQAERYLNGLVKKDETWKVDGSRHRAVGGSQSEAIGKDKDMEVTGDHREHTKGAHHALVDGSQLTEVKSDDHLTVGNNKLTDVGVMWHTKVGMEVIVDAGMSITLKVGGNFIKIDPSGIQIEGTMVRINCGGAPGPGVLAPTKPDKYKGPHAKRYDRSFKS